MGKIFMVVMGLMLAMVWLGLLIPQYAAWKNKCYKTVAICLSTLSISIAAFVALLIYGDFINALWNGVEHSRAADANDFILSAFGLVFVVGHYVCWWYIYGRKSLDFIHLKGHTAAELDQILSPECKKLLGLNTK